VAESSVSRSVTIRERSLADVLAGATRADFSERQAIYLVPLPKHGFMRLSDRAFVALSLHAKGASLEAAAEATRSGDDKWDGSRLGTIRDRLFSRVHDDTEQVNSVGFFGRRQLLASHHVSNIAVFLTRLYQPTIAIILVALASVTFAMTFQRDPEMSAAAIGWGYMWLVLSLFTHELGHASALARFGRTPGGIGFTFYVVYPALYSDVTDAWPLRRWQRLVIDIGGVYFQLLFAAGLLVAGRCAGVPGAHVGAMMIGLTVAMTMNPFLKFDGYWVVSDALGIANLAKQRRAMLFALWARARRRGRVPFPWHRHIAVIVAVYSLANVVFTVSFALYLAPHGWRALREYPEHLRAAVADLADHAYPHTAAPWLALIGATLVLYFLARVAYRLGCQTLVALKRRW